MFARSLLLAITLLSAPGLLAAVAAAQSGPDLVDDDFQLSTPSSSDFVLQGNDLFGHSVAHLGDLNGDGVGDIAVGAVGDNAVGDWTGAVWILFPHRDGSIRAFQKICPGEGGFGGILGDMDYFGWAVTGIGDLDGDGTIDLAVGSRSESEGAVWILFLRPTGTVRSWQKISARDGGFSGTLNPGADFGLGLAPIGDLDADGVPDLAVGAPGVTVSGQNTGAVWILSLNANGTVKAEQEISGASGGFGGVLEAGDSFGISVAPLGDFDGDGITDLAVGADGDDDGADNAGAVWMLFLQTDGTVKAHQKISATVGGFGGSLDPSEKFGAAITVPGDLDADGVTDLMVGAPRDDDGGFNYGAAWTLFLRPDGTVRAEQKISADHGGFGGSMMTMEQFGCALAPLGDLNGDGIVEVAVGALGNDDWNADSGGVWILSLDSTGICRAEQEINNFSFWTEYSDERWFGSSVADAGDLNGDGWSDLLVGAPEAQGGGEGRGAFWIMLLNPSGYPAMRYRIGDGEGGFTGALDDFDHFGAAVARSATYCDYVVGAPGDDGGGTDRGAIWLLRGNPPGSIWRQEEIGDMTPGMLARLDDGDHFGASVSTLIDLDGDGYDEIVVGAPGDDDGELDAGAVYILFLHPYGLLRSVTKIGAGAGGFGGTLAAGDGFGTGVAGLDDLNGDGRAELAVSASGADDGGFDRGAVWILSLDADGFVTSEWKVASGTGGFEGVLADGDGFGSAVGAAGDFNGDGTPDLIIGASGDDTAGVDRGAAWLVCLDPGGFARSHRKIAHSVGGFPSEWWGGLWDNDRFGGAACSLGDLDGNGARELVIGAPRADSPPQDLGAAFILFCNPIMSASAVSRLGSGANPDIFSSTHPPVLGGNWSAEVDAGAIGADGVVFVFVYGAGHPGIPIVCGELLLDPFSPSLATHWAVASGGVSSHEIPVPYDLVFSGATASAQAYLVDVAPSGQLTNALDLTFGF